MECFLLCLLVYPMPDHHCTRLCPFLFCTTPLTPNLQSNCSFIFGVRFCMLLGQMSKIVSSPSSCSMHHTYEAILYRFVSVPADLFIFFRPDRLQHHNMKWCWQCTSLFFHHLLQLLMVCIFKEYILHKKMRKGGKTVCAIKNTKIQFHTCDRDPSTYHEYDIHKLLTLLYYSTYTILKLVPALRYVFPHDAIVSSTNTQQICSTTVQKNLVLKSQGIFDASLNLT